MFWPLLVGCLVLGTKETASGVYHFRDSSGMDHYVNHLEQVPAGLTSDRVNLNDDLNPELAREMADAARRASEEAKQRAAEAAPSVPGAPGLPPLPPEARLLLVWALAFTVVFAVLWLARVPLLRRALPLAVAFQPIRWGTAVAALACWISLAFLSRDWLMARVPPLHAIARVKSNVDKINQQREGAERELDKALNGH